MLLSIRFNKSKSSTDNLTISIDDNVVTYKILDDHVILYDQVDIKDGLHQLKVSLKDPDSFFEIEDVIVDGSSSKDFFYFSYIHENHKIIQPASLLWKTGVIWVYPFALPSSHFHNLMWEKFGGMPLPEGITKEYDIFWPTSIDVGPHYPPLVREFFSRDFDFLVLRKNDRSKNRRPFQKMSDFSVPIPVEHELLNKISTVKDNGVAPFYKQSMQDDKNLDISNCWKVAFLFNNKHEYDDQLCQYFPETLDWIKSLELDPVYAWVSVLEQNQYIPPHIDTQMCNRKLRYHENTLGCLISIPIGWTPGVWYKFGSVGIIPAVPCVINNNHFVHAMVNNGSAPRLALGLRVSLDQINGRWGIDLTE